MLKNLELQTPIAFIDVETTGKNPNSDRVVELSIFKIKPDGTQEFKSHKVNPGVPIPSDATAIHGITDADVVSLPLFRQYAKSVSDFLDGCDISGFNVIKFDLPCLEAEFSRAGVAFSRSGRNIIDSMVIYHQRDPRDLQSAYRKYCGAEMENAHMAEEDAKASAAVLDGQLAMYDDLPKDAAGLSALCCQGQQNYIDFDGKFIWVDGEAVCNFSKENKGLRLKDIALNNPGFLIWILDKDFSPKVKDLVSKALRGEFPQKG